MPSDEGTPQSDRRPLLARGEQLKDEATRPGSPGKKFHPVSASQAWTSLAPMGAAMTRGIDLLPPSGRGKHVVFEATLRPNYLASSYFPDRVLAKDGIYPVGSRKARETKVTKSRVKEGELTRKLLLAGEPEAVKRFAKRVQRSPTTATAKEWDELRRFCSIGLPSAESVIVQRPSSAQRTPITFEAVLTHVFDSPARERVWADEHFRRFALWVEEHGGVVDSEYRRDLAGLTFVPILAPAAALNEIASFNLLRALRPMPSIAPFPDDLLRSVQSKPQLSEAALNGAIPDDVVAIFDGGVNPNLPCFSPFVTAYDLTSLKPNEVAMCHGSVVTSALLYGSLDGGQLPNPTTCVDHYRVFPLKEPEPGKPDHRLYEMLDRVTETLRERTYSMVVLSIGPNESVEEDAEPNRFTAELDQLAKSESITFVCAVGNNGDDDAPLGFDRVQPPGDMVNGIGVGAVEGKSRRPKDVQRAAYSARGPGREGQRVQPLVVEFGGGAAEPFVGFDHRGRLVQAKGTSFATPAAGRAIAGLRARLDEERHRPEVLRAFAAHFAERPYGHKKKFLEVGYGRVPESFGASFSCPANEVTVLYEDELPRGVPTALRFPMPRGINPETSLQLRWTISYVTDVDPRESSDYTLSGIDATYRPNSFVRSLTDPATGASTKVHLHDDAEAIRQALLQGHSLSHEPRSRSSWRYTASEQRLRQDGKWETILSGSAKPKAGTLHEPRIDLVHLRRMNGQLISGSEIQPLPFAMLLTIRASKDVDIYDAVAAEYNVLEPLIQVPIRVRTVA